MATFTVTVARVGEGQYQDAEFTVEAVGVAVGENGRLSIQTATGGQHLAADSWGAFKVVRVASSADRV
jgi:hypothetical protein